MNRQAQGIVMLLFGGAILKASLTDMYLRYVKEGLRPFLIAAGLLLVASAVMTLWYDLRGPRAAAASPTGEDGPPATGAGPGHDGAPGHGDGHGDGADDGHGHAHHEPKVGWLLILPVLGLLLVAPPALGSYAAGQAGSVLTTQNEQADYPPLPAGDPAQISLLDYASRAIFDDGRTMIGKNVELLGFITTGTDGKPMLTRMVLSCCAADGRPIKVGLTGDAPSGLAPDTWVRVVGTYADRREKDPVNEAPVPYFAVKTWQQTTAPKDPYE